MSVKLTPEAKKLHATIKRTRKKSARLQTQMEALEESADQMEELLALKVCPFPIGSTVQGGRHETVRGIVEKISYHDDNGKPSYRLLIIRVRKVRIVGGKERLGRERVWPETLRGNTSKIQLVTP